MKGNCEKYEKILVEGCEKNKLDYRQAVEYFYRKRERQYDLMDIDVYCKCDSNFSDEVWEKVRSFDSGDFECICDLYRDDYDCNLSVWDNMHRAIMDYVDLI